MGATRRILFPSQPSCFFMYECPLHPASRLPCSRKGAWAQSSPLGYSPADNTDLLCDLRLISKVAVFCSEVALQLPAQGGAGQKQGRTQDTNYAATGLHTWGGQTDRWRSVGVCYIHRAVSTSEGVSDDPKGLKNNLTYKLELLVAQTKYWALKYHYLLMDPCSSSRGHSQMQQSDGLALLKNTTALSIGALMQL